MNETQLKALRIATQRQRDKVARLAWQLRRAIDEHSELCEPINTPRTGIVHVANPLDITDIGWTILNKLSNSLPIE